MKNKSMPKEQYNLQNRTPLIYAERLTTSVYLCMAQSDMIEVLEEDKITATLK